MIRLIQLELSVNVSKYDWCLNSVGPVANVHRLHRSCTTSTLLSFFRGASWCMVNMTYYGFLDSGLQHPENLPETNMRQSSFSRQPNTNARWSGRKEPLNFHIFFIDLVRFEKKRSSNTDLHDSTGEVYRFFYIHISWLLFLCIYFVTAPELSLETVR